MWQNPQFPADVVTYTEEIRNGKRHFYSVLEASMASMIKLFGKTS